MRAPTKQWLGNLSAAALLLAAAAPAASAQATIQFFAGTPSSQPSLGGPMTTPSATPFCTTTTPDINFPSAAAFTSFVAANCASAPAGFNGFGFSARLVGSFTTLASGNVGFTLSTDDGLSLFINGVQRSPVGFVDQATTNLAFLAPLNAGANPFQLDFYTNSVGTSFLTLTGQGVTVSPLATSTVPEPSTYALFATGLLGLAGVARRKAKR